jgi:hypothetical protein
MHCSQGIGRICSFWLISIVKKLALVALQLKAIESS